MILIIGIICISGISSCGSSRTARSITGNGGIGLYKKHYFLPVYAFEDEFKVDSKTALNFVKNTNFGLDSVFSNHPTQYNTGERLFPQNERKALNILKETNFLFGELIENNSAEVVDIPKTMRLFSQEAGAVHIMLLYVQPSFNHSNRLSSISIDVAVIDISRDKIIAHRRASGRAKGNLSYSHHVLNVLERLK